MHELSAGIVSRRQVAEGMWVLAMDAPEIAAQVAPGQFVNLGQSPGPLLRRPFSVYRVDGDRIEIVLRAVGTGTRLLLDLEPGDRISCLGPLGRGFELDPAAGPAILVSGGLGVAPMPITAARAGGLGIRVIWIHGARTAAELCSEWSGDELIWATDDGSHGVRGTAVGAAPPGPGQVLACGPNPMLEAVARRWPEAQVAVETYMGCGTGVCLGCAVPLRAGGYDRACSEGPVYRAAAIDWESLPGRLHYEVAV